MTRIGRLILKSPEPGANQPDLSGSPTNPHPLANSDFVNPSLIPSVPFRREPLTIPDDNERTVQSPDLGLALSFHRAC